MQISDRLAKETARDYALRIIKQNIVNLELEPGSMVSENELSALLHLSRTPVREALHDLSRAKLVEVLPQKGSRVSLVDYGMVEEAQFLRYVLEMAVVELLCKQAPELDFDRLNENVVLQEFYRKSDAQQRLWELDNAFHKELFRLCNKTQTYKLMSNMTTHFDRVRKMSLPTMKEIKIVDDHIELSHAIQAQDVDRAKAIMDVHLSRYKIDEDAIRKRYPSYIK